MTELALSNNLAQIELEINHHKQNAGQSIWEIGRRLNHVKERDLAHGQFGRWLEKIGIQYREANRMMTVAKKLPNVTTLSHLGSAALYLIATLPEDEKQAQMNRIEQGDSLTVRELQAIRKRYSAAKQRIAQLESREPAPPQVKEVVKEVIKEVVPDDYKEALERSEVLSQQAKSAEERNAFLEQQLQDLYAQRAEVDEKSAKYDALTKAIQQSKSELSETQSRIGNYKNLLSFLRKGNDMLLHMGGILYVDEERIINSDFQIRKEFEQLQQSVNRLADDLNRMVQGDTNIIEGEFS